MAAERGKIKTNDLLSSSAFAFASASRISGLATFKIVELPRTRQEFRMNIEAKIGEQFCVYVPKSNLGLGEVRAGSELASNFCGPHAGRAQIVEFGQLWAGKNRRSLFLGRFCQFSRT